MASSYKTPGVYIEEISKLPPSVAQVETAVPAFIGYTEKAVKMEKDDLLFVPTRITSLVEYEEYFGSVNPVDMMINVELTEDVSGAISAVTPLLDDASVIARMYYSLQMFFANGGGPCYIVSVGRTDSIPTSASVNTIVTPGNENVPDDFKFGLGKLEYEDEPTLILFPDAHMLDDDDYYTIYEEALKQCGNLKDRFTIVDVRPNPDASSNSLSTDDPKVLLRDTGMSNLKYGAAYYPNLKTVLNYRYDENNVTVFDSQGSRSLYSIKTTDTLKYNTIKSEIRNHLTLELSPGAAIAGVYAQVDNDRGVWKAPANVTISKVEKPTVEITDEDQKNLNVDVTSGKSINAIRKFAGKGVLVWGARTLAGNDNEWRYISVRRFYNMVEESVKKSTFWAVFEPNDANTWTKVKAMIENYLTTLWRDGALAGAKTEEAFFVKVGLGETMTAQDILEGRMNVEIGMAVVRPAEFIILKFSHKMQES